MFEASSIIEVCTLPMMVLFSTVIAAPAPLSVPVVRGALRFPLELDTRYPIPMDYEAIAWQSGTRPNAARRRSAA